jgi:type VI secretion system (T6SS) effector TldE1-like protein
MTSAIKTARRAQKLKPRNCLSNHRWIVLRALTGTLAVVAIVFITVTTVLMGAGWLLAISLEARSNLRFVVALAPPSEWAGAPASAMARQSSIVATLSSPATSRSSERPVLNPIGALALVIPYSSDSLDNSSDDQTYTGSLQAQSTKLAALDVASAGHSETPSPLNDRHPQPLPLPRAQSRLAALSPIEDLGVQTGKDSRSLRTAIYDITARTVYLPNGERLEAHSGLGELMDDVRYVRRKNRGATPPNTYELTLRESLFHGVQAIRLIPVGDGDMFDRNGILAHSYMLGPSGQSNGCVSFKDYPRFLRAYLRGEVDRIVVVSRLTKPPTFAARPNLKAQTEQMLSALPPKADMD